MARASFSALGFLLSLCAGGVGCSAGNDGGQNAALPAGQGGSSANGGSAGSGQGGTGGLIGQGGSGQGGSGQGGIIGLGGGGSGSGQSGCRKVDFLFVIDNSVSMQDQQNALISSFPGFIDAIQNSVNASDYHVMVVDSDAETRCSASACNSPNLTERTLCVEPESGYACGNTFSACDTVMGAGVVQPAGQGASNRVCDFAGGNRYMLGSDPDLETAFACAAQVGLAGHPSERPMDAMVAAMTPDLNGPGGCNEGFLRDDAILVVTFISDDPKYEDTPGPSEWYYQVAEAKNGNVDSVVMLGLTPDFEGCRRSGEVSGSHWAEFVNLWPNHIHASVCELDYSGFFQQAVAVIDTTCDAFEPPK